MFTLDPTAALWFAIATAPLTAFVCWSDLSKMLIYNKTVLLLMAVFFCIAPFVLPWNVIAWQALYAMIALVIVFLLTSFGILGAGDSKFIAAAALYIMPSDWPMIMPSDWPMVALLLAATTIAAVIIHRGARALGAAKLTPEWESWARAKDFPFGLALGPTLSFYLILSALGA